jgi:hypothetical protein
MKFNPVPVQDGLFTADELVKDGGWGGTRNFVWDHEKYWSQLVRMCAEIRAKQMARWRKLGARVGCDEWDYKSEDVVDISPPAAPASEAEPETQAATAAKPQPQPEAATPGVLPASPAEPLGTDYGQVQAPPGNIDPGADAPIEAETEVATAI